MIASPIAGLLVLLAAAPGAAGEGVGALQPLVGTWDAEGGGAPGKGAGTVEFTREVGGHAIVRRNVVAYPAAEGKPASRHEDLLVIHEDGDATKALYVDGEGHVIRYSAVTGSHARACERSRRGAAVPAHP
jgi:hypothetical protein